jgi:capsular polysaccharide biosynthesis protein
MNTGHILTRLVRLWWLTALLAVLGALAGFGYGHLTPPTYVARAYVVVVATDPSESTSAVSYAQTYARVALQGDVVDSAAASGQVPRSELRQDVQATGSPDAPVIEITGSSGTADRAATLANLMSAGLVSTANEHSTSTRMKLTMLSSATPPTSAASPKPILNAAVGAAVGILLGGLVALAGADRASATGRGRREDGEPAGRPEDPDGGRPARNVAVARIPADGDRPPVVMGLPADEDIPRRIKPPRANSTTWRADRR